MTDQNEFGLGRYLSNRVRYYKFRYVLMSIVIIVSVAIFIITSSLFIGIQSRSEIPISIVGIRYLISNIEAYTISQWLIFVSILLIFISSAAIYNTIRSSIWYSKKDIGILKAVGISEKEIIKIFLAEIIWISLISWIFGLFTGLIIVNQFFHHFYIQGISSMFFAPSRTVPSIVLISLILTVLVAVIGGLKPIIKASKIRFYEAFSEKY